MECHWESSELPLRAASALLFALNIHVRSYLFCHSVSCVSLALWDKALYGRVIINVYGNWAALFTQSNGMFKQEEVHPSQLVASVLKVP